VDGARGVEVERQLHTAAGRHVELADQLVAALHAARNRERIRSSSDHHVRSRAEEEPNLRVVTGGNIALGQLREYAVAQLEQVEDGGGIERQRFPPAAVFIVAAVDGDPGHDQVDLLVNDIAHELYVQAGTLTVEVVSARELSAALRASVTELLQQQTDAKTVVMHESVDQELLGGFVARTADAELDASVRTKLRALSALT